MTREEKKAVIDSLSARLNAHPHFYLVDIAGLNAQDTSVLRKKCFEANVKLVTVKNTLFSKALEGCGRGDFGGIESVLRGSTAVFFSDVANAPAKLIKEFRTPERRAVLKAAYAEESVYVGDDQLEVLASLKSHDELVADVIALLESPAKNVISSLQSGAHILSGVVKTLSERVEK